MKRTILLALRLSVRFAVAAVRLRPRHAATGPCGAARPTATWSRTMKGIPDHLGRQDQEEREVDGGARLAELRQSRGGGRPGLRRHQQRTGAQSQGARRPRRADVLPRIGRQVSLAAHQRQAGRGPRQRLAVSGRLLLAAGGRRPPLLRHQPLRAGLPGYARRRQRRRQGHLEVRHDGGGRLAAAQHVELVAGLLRRSDLRQHLQRPGREPRAHSVAARARR